MFRWEQRKIIFELSSISRLFWSFDSPYIHTHLIHTIPDEFITDKLKAAIPRWFIYVVLFQAISVFSIKIKMIQIHDVRYAENIITDYELKRSILRRYRPFAKK